MKKAIIIGAGPAGLTAAYELLTKTDIIPIIIEADKQVGGLSKTINYKGNKIDIGGHRFFSKSEKVINWWLHFLPLDSAEGTHIDIRYQNKNVVLNIDRKQAGNSDNIMLLRPRKSRIFYHRNFFDYPLKLNGKTTRNLGIMKMIRISNSYVWAKLFPERPEKNLAQFFRNRFGKELYKTFFKDYTEKVWGVPCERISASWGHQRVKDLNISKVIWHAITSVFTSNKSINQGGTSTSLIEQFLYPKYGPGQMWETVADEITKRGGKILLNTTLKELQGDGTSKIISAKATDINTGEEITLTGDFFFSTMPIKELTQELKSIPLSEDARSVGESLEYRDFLIVGILASELSAKEKDGEAILKDNWIYIQDNDVKAARIQVFNNWSPFLVNNPGDIWIGVEYFCNETDSFWQLDDESIKQIAIKEMEKIGMLKPEKIKDSMVARVLKAYPSYYGSYNNFPVLQRQLDMIENLFLIGRNGMHRYNNSDHSMLTAMEAVDNIITGRKDRTNIWEVNSEEEYHEEQSIK